MGASHTAKVSNTDLSQEDVEEINMLKKYRYKPKVVVVGTPGSGKSTLCRQMRMLYGEPLTEADRLSYVDAIRKHTVYGMIQVLNGMDRAGITFACYDRKVDARNLRELVESWEREGKGPVIDLNLGCLITRLWKDCDLQTFLNLPGNHSIFRDNLSHFVAVIYRLCCSDYIPPDEDIACVKMVGRWIEIFKITLFRLRAKYNIMDVSLPAASPSHYRYLFATASTVMFTVPVGDFDLFMHKERNEKNSLIRESLATFENILKDKKISTCLYIITLTKCDIFRRKLDRIPLNKVFPDYQGPNEYEECIAYIQGLFKNVCKKGKQIVYIRHMDSTHKDEVVTSVETCFKALTVVNNMLSSGMV